MLLTGLRCNISNDVTPPSDVIADAYLSWDRGVEQYLASPQVPQTSHGYAYYMMSYDNGARWDEQLNYDMIPRGFRKL